MRIKVSTVGTTAADNIKPAVEVSRFSSRLLPNVTMERNSLYVLFASLIMLIQLPVHIKSEKTRENCINFYYRSGPIFRPFHASAVA